MTQIGATCLGVRGFILLIGLTLAFVSGGCGVRKPLSPESVIFREQRLRELLRSGTERLRSNQIENARAAFTVARDLSPEDPRVLDGLGCVAWRERNIRLAAHYFRQAAEANSEYDRPVAHLALVAEARGHRRAARELLRRAIAMNPMSFRARNNLAAELIRSGFSEPPTDAAYRELLKAYELAGPNEPVIRHNLADAPR